MSGDGSANRGGQPPVGPLPQSIQAGTARVNVTAREVRAQFGWL